MINGWACRRACSNFALAPAAGSTRRWSKRDSNHQSHAVLRLYRLAWPADDRHRAALLIIYIRLFVKEPEIWVENQRQQKAQNRQVRAPLFSIFKPQCDRGVGQRLSLRSRLMAIS